MPSHSPPGWVRKTVNSTAKTIQNTASAYAHGSQPTLRTARTTSPSRQPPARRPCTTTAPAKNVKRMKPVMNVDSLVANDSASRAAMIDGPEARGRSRKRKMATSRPSVIAAM